MAKVSRQSARSISFFISTHVACYTSVVCMKIRIPGNPFLSSSPSFPLWLSFSLFLVLALFRAASIKMPDVGSRKRFAVIRDIVTRVHVVTVRIRDGVTRYALCTHVTPRGAAADAFPPSVPRCTTAPVDDSRSLCEKRVTDVHRLHFRVRYAENKRRRSADL